MKKEVVPFKVKEMPIDEKKSAFIDELLTGKKAEKETPNEKVKPQKPSLYRKAIENDNRS